LFGLYLRLVAFGFENLFGDTKDEIPEAHGARKVLALDLPFGCNKE